MNADTTLALIIDSLGSLGTAIFVILGATLVIGVGILVFKFGWDAIRWSTDERGVWYRNTFYGYDSRESGFRHKGSEL